MLTTARTTVTFPPSNSIAHRNVLHQVNPFSDDLVKATTNFAESNRSSTGQIRHSF
jgi:hypothetical protein